MKKISAIAILASGLVAMPAAANTLTYNVQADVGSVCGVYKFDGPTVTVDFDTLSATPTSTQVTEAAGSATYRCNSTAGFTRTVSSANGGYLTLNGATTTDNLRRIPFTMSHGGGSGLGFAATQLTAPITSNFGGSAAFLAGQTGSVNFQTNGVQAAVGGNDAPGTTVFAGDYSDVVTITVTAL